MCMKKRNKAIAEKLRSGDYEYPGGGLVKKKERSEDDGDDDGH